MMLRTSPPPKRKAPPGAQWLQSAPPSAVDLPQVSECRGYIDGLGGFLATFASFSVLAVLDCGRLLGLPVSASLVWDQPPVAITVGALWQVKLSWATRGNPGTRLQLLFWGLVTILGISLMTSSVVLPSGLIDAVWIGVCGGLCLRLADRRGVSVRTLGIGPAWAANRAGRIQVLTVAGIAAAVACASATALGSISRMVGAATTGHPRPAPASDYLWAFLNDMTHMAAAGIMEELVVVACLVTALEAARRPVWLIYTLSLLARLSYHLYLGPGSLGVLIMGAVYVALYRHTRRLTLLILAHFGYNVFSRYGGLSAAEAINMIGLLTMACLVLWVAAHPSLGSRDGEHIDTGVV